MDMGDCISPHSTVIAITSSNYAKLHVTLDIEPLLTAWGNVRYSACIGLPVVGLTPAHLS